MKQCIFHLHSKLHTEKVGGLCGCGGSNCDSPKYSSPVETMLSCPTQRTLHEKQLGFNVDKILEAIQSADDIMAQHRTDGVVNIDALDTPDQDWLKIISRRYIGWNGY